MALIALGAAAGLAAGCAGTRNISSGRVRAAPTRIVASRAVQNSPVCSAPRSARPISYSRSDAARFVPPPPPPPVWRGTTVTRVSRAPTWVRPAAPVTSPRVLAPRERVVRTLPAPVPMRRAVPVRRRAPRAAPKSSGLFGCLDGT